jgi:hypothetical protein
MASDDIADVTQKLEGTKVDEKNLLSFKGKGLKLNKPEDGRSTRKEHFFYSVGRKNPCVIILNRNLRRNIN